MAPKTATKSAGGSGATPGSMSMPNTSRLELLEYHRGHVAGSVVLPGGDDVNAAAAKKGQRGAAKASVGPDGRGWGLLSVLRAAFLPEGFPESVSPDYLSFQAWDTVQALSSYVRGMLTSAAILRGVGVGQQASTPLAAVFTFFLRDLAGMAGGILFAYAEGSSFDACAKQWRLFADITNDLGMTVELASPLLPRAMFLPCACFGSIARSVTGVAGGATRAALTQHFARRGNAADVSAKEQSQETATTIIGMVLGMAVTRLLATDPHATADPSGPTGSSGSRAVWAVLAAWLVFGLLTVLHVWANVRAMRCLVLRSLNQPRLELLVTGYLRQEGDNSSSAGATGGGGGGGRVLSPLQVSALEDLTPPPFRRLWDWASGAARRRPVQMHFGCRLAAAVAAASRTGAGAGGGAQEPQEQPRLRQALARASRRPYLLLASTSSPCGGGSGGGGGAAPLSAPPRGGGGMHVHVVLHRRVTAAAAAVAAPDTAAAAAAADSVDARSGAGAGPAADGLLRAFVHAHCLAHQLRLLQPRHVQAAQTVQRTRPEGAAGTGSAATTATVAAGAVAAAEAAADEWMATRYEPFLAALAAAGWHTDRVTLPRPAWTAEWGPAGGPAEAAREGERQKGVHED